MYLATPSFFKMDCQIGIDLGTNNCCVAVFRDDRVDIIPDEEGHRTIPSYVSFTDNGVLLGHAAKARVHVDPKNTIFDVMLLLGKKRIEVLNHLQKLPYDVIKTSQGQLKIKVTLGDYNSGTETMFPEEILAIFLSHFKHMASKYLQKPVTGAVISHPHSLNLLQIQLLRTAANTAGLSSVKLTSSSALSALAFGHQNKLHHLRTSQRQLSMLVFDMGGGSTEASLVFCNGRDYLVSGASCTFNSSGNDVTGAIYNYLREELKKQLPDVDTSDSSVATKLKLYYQCERIKKDLSCASTAYLDLDSIFPGAKGVITISRDNLDAICEDLLMSALEVMHDAFRIANFDANEVDQCVLVGGSSRLPNLQTSIAKLFRNPLNKSLNSDEAVAYGAAIQAAQLTNTLRNPQSPLASNCILKELVPNSINLELDNGKMYTIIHQGSNYPIETMKKFNIVQMDPVNLKMFEGENNMGSRGNVMIASVKAKPIAIGVINVRTQYTRDKTLGIEVTDEKSSKCLLKQENICRASHMADELEFMRVRLLSFEEQLERKFKYMEAKNALEEYIISVKSQIKNGALEGHAAEEVTKKCDDAIELIDDMGALGGIEQITKLRSTLERLYAEKCSQRQATNEPPKDTANSKVTTSLSVSVMDGSVGQSVTGVQVELICGGQQIKGNGGTSQCCFPVTYNVDTETLKSGQGLKLRVTDLDKYFAKTIYPVIEVSLAILETSNNWEVCVTVAPFSYTVVTNSKR